MRALRLVRRAEQIFCPAKRINGIVTDGGYAEYSVFKAGFLTKLPDGLHPVAAAPLTDVCGNHRVRRASAGGIRAESRVAIIGAGGIGTLAIRYAVAMGALVAIVSSSRR